MVVTLCSLLSVPLERLVHLASLYFINSMDGRSTPKGIFLRCTFITRQRINRSLPRKDVVIMGLATQPFIDPNQCSFHEWFSFGFFPTVKIFAEMDNEVARLHFINWLVILSQIYPDIFSSLT